MVDTTTDWITALATCFAAVGTVGALFYAARASKAASKTADEARRAVEAEARPLLLDVPYEPYTDYEHEYPWPPEGMRKCAWRGQIIVDPENGTFVFPIRNVGRGPARIESFSLNLVDVDAGYSEYGGRSVPVGDDHWLAAQPQASGELVTALRSVPSPTHGPMPYVFSVVYADISGRQEQRLELGVGTRQGDSALRVLRVENVSLSA